MGNQVILLVEDDCSISEMVSNYLQQAGFEVVCAFDGLEAEQRFRERKYALVLLDIMLPEKSGLDFLQNIRKDSVVPVLILSAKNDEVDKSLGLGYGADDYITKPFSMLELTARINAAIRRATKYVEINEGVDSKDIVCIHELTVDLENLTVTKLEKEIKLTATEWKLLKLFITNPKKNFTKEQIYQDIWQTDYHFDDNVINVHMRRLREKIEDNPSQPKYIQTLWGFGYRLGEFS